MPAPVDDYDVSYLEDFSLDSTAIPWVCEGLQIAPGRVVGLIGLPGSGKTILAQTAAIALITGLPIWGAFPVARACRVLHVDLDQGVSMIKRRYSDLAADHGLDPSEYTKRLGVAKNARSLVYTDPATFEAAWTKRARAWDLVIVDSLKSLSPYADENDSRVDLPLRILERISEDTGTCFLVIAHSGKDVSKGARGNNSIEAAFGCELLVQELAKGRRITQRKAYGECVKMQPFFVQFSQGARTVAVVAEVRDRASPGDGITIPAVELAKRETREDVATDARAAAVEGKVLTAIREANTRGDGMAGKAELVKVTGTRRDDVSEAVVARRRCGRDRQPWHRRTASAVVGRACN